VSEAVPFYLDYISSNAYLAWEAFLPLAARYERRVEPVAVLGIPLRPPPAHPFNPLLALRVTLLPMSDAERVGLVTGLLRAEWAERRDVSDPSVVRDVAAAAGLDGPGMVEAAAQPGIKQALRDATDAAIEAGVFGVPMLQVDGELFWGYDDLPWVERRLAGEDPLDEKQLERWMAEAPRVAAWRPGVPPRER
jgi:2-hydroxychromene-2-carboxylate isomerase